MNRAVRSEQGFTIIELLLAMTFVSMLLLAIAATVIQIGTIYNRGLTMKAVDQSGREVSTDLQRTIGQSQPFDTASSFRQQRYPETPINDADGGRLCTGTYSYIWNYGRSLKKPINTYVVGDAEIRLVRVRDAGGQYCADPTKRIEIADATELLSAGDRNVAVQSFAITEVASNPTISQAIYRIVLEIGTNDQSALQRDAGLTTIDTSCRPPSDDASQQDFCAVNKFEFTAQAGNKGGQ